MERSARMLAALDRLEADLHSRDAEMATYSELIERHSQTQQIACKVTDEHLGDDNLPVLDVIVGQLLAFFRCLQEGLRPDSPSESGVIHRVVQGFTLHLPTA